MPDQPNAIASEDKTVRSIADGKRLVLSAGFDTKASCGLSFFPIQPHQNCNSNTALYLINADGSNLTRLTKIETTYDARDTLKWLSG